MTSGPFGVRLAEKLLSELGRAPGITGKIRYAARNWQQIQSLTKEDRERVALTLGSRQGSRLLEKFLARDGELSPDEAAVQRAFERLGDADPDDLREVASSLRSGDFDKLRRELVKSVPEAEVPPVPVVEEEDLLDAGEPEETVAPLDAFETLETAQPVEVPQSISDQPVETAEDLDFVFDRDEDTDCRVEEPFSLLRVDSEARPSASQRLALLRGLHSGSLTLPTRADRADFLDRLETDWAVRRGLSQLIQLDLLADLDEALDLLARIDSAAQRTWCLGDLIEYWDLDPVAIDRVLAAAPSAAASRRLGRRVAG